MSSLHNDSTGFTTIELLVTLFIGTLLVAGGYQLYGVVMKHAQLSQLQAAASNVSYEILRLKTSEMTTCSAGSENGTTLIPANSGLPSDARYTITTECLYSSSTARISVAVFYTTDGTERSVTRALYAH
jgi:Tfp pilus assembly protein PilE